MESESLQLKYSDRRRLSTVSGEYFGDPVLADSFPACLGRVVVDVHEAGVQIPGEDEALVEDERDAVIAVAGSVNDLAVKPDGRKESPAIFQL